MSVRNCGKNHDDSPRQAQGKQKGKEKVREAEKVVSAREGEEEGGVGISSPVTAVPFCTANTLRKSPRRNASSFVEFTFCICPEPVLTNDRVHQKTASNRRVCVFCLSHLVQESVGPGV